jgi:integrase
MRRADLTEREVAKLAKIPGKVHWVAKNLYIDTTSGASWIYRFMVDGQPRAMGLGSLYDVRLAEARERARQARLLAKDGTDPIEARRGRRAAIRAERAKAMTFKECAEAYLQANENAWKSAKHRHQWRSTLATYVYPICGALPVQQFDQATAVRILLPIWTTKAETARRLRMRLETIIEWAIAAQFFRGDNPATKDRLKHLLGNQSDRVRHHKAIPYKDIPAFIERLRDYGGVGALPLEFTTLTATRTSEVLLARWDEINLSTRLWTIPAPHRKGRKGKESPLVVPLSDRCREILDQVGKDTEKTGLIFRSPTGRRLGENALLDTLKKQLGYDATPHGMRSAFRDWAGDCTSFESDVVEMALGHKVGTAVVRAYRRGSAQEKRAALMESWSRYCSGPADDTVVVPLARGARSG